MCCFRRWTKQPRATARTSARCIVGTIYQSNHALQTLNTATVFSASLFFAAIFLTSLPLPRSVWTAPLLVQLSPANACKEKWPRLKVMGGTGVPFKWYICPPAWAQCISFCKNNHLKKKKEAAWKRWTKNLQCHRPETQAIKQVLLILCRLSTLKWWFKIIFYNSNRENDIPAIDTACLAGLVSMNHKDDFGTIILRQKKYTVLL